MNLIIAENQQSVNGDSGLGFDHSTIPTDLISRTSHSSLTDNAIAKKSYPYGEPLHEVVKAYFAALFSQKDYDDVTAQGENAIAVARTVLLYPI